MFKLYIIEYICFDMYELHEIQATQYVIRYARIVFAMPHLRMYNLCLCKRMHMFDIF